MSVGRGYRNSPNPTYLETNGDQREVRGRQVQAELDRKQIHRMLGGSGAHTPDLTVLCKENTSSFNNRASLEYVPVRAFACF